eukprot:COSAG01_NODE_41823_length_446_cov_17.890490_1_plen_46_part_10
MCRGKARTHTHTHRERERESCLPTTALVRHVVVVLACEVVQHAKAA